MGLSRYVARYAHYSDGGDMLVSPSLTKRLVITSHEEYLKYQTEQCGTLFEGC